MFEGVLMKEYTIDEIQELMKKGELTAKKLTEDYFERINEIDKKGPKLNSIIEINPDALDIAEKLDEERKKMSNDRNRTCIYKPWLKGRVAIVSLRSHLTSVPNQGFEPCLTI